MLHAMLLASHTARTLASQNVFFVHHRTPIDVARANGNPLESWTLAHSASSCRFLHHSKTRTRSRHSCSQKLQHCSTCHRREMCFQRLICSIPLLSARARTTMICFFSLSARLALENINLPVVRWQNELQLGCWWINSPILWGKKERRRRTWKVKKKNDLQAGEMTRLEFWAVDSFSWPERGRNGTCSQCQLLF